jgi:xanthine/CO dehydrogenase XdhC/CoxF family maturation factor
MGCGGAFDVLIERLDELDRDETMRRWLTVLERGEKAALVVPLRGASGRIIVQGSGEQIGHLSDPAIEKEARARAHICLSGSPPQSGPERIDGGELFFEVSLPAPELVIFGAGPDAGPVAQQAWTLGFSVTVVDVRTAYLTKALFPAAKLVSAHFTQFAAAVPLTSGTSVLVMNHQLERDEESLRYALESAAGYVGVLGPRTRYERLLAHLASTGYTPSAECLERVHSPVGLSIGAETPDEVAVSILAEVLAVERGFAGGFLSGFSGSLHRSDDKRRLTSS